MHPEPENSAVVRFAREQPVLAMAGAKDRLTVLPDEIILTILAYLDIPELWELTKTNRRLCFISQDPLLHRNRLRDVRTFLAVALTKRPPLQELRIPRRIWLSQREMAGRRLARSLTKIKLNKCLRNRPDLGYLVERGVLPAGYIRKSRVTQAQAQDEIASSSSQADVSGSAGERSQQKRSAMQRPAALTQQNTQVTFYYHYTPTVSPILLSACVALEKQLVKDRLRDWYQTKRPSLEEFQARHHASTAAPVQTPSPSPVETRRPTVRYLVTRFASRFRDGEEQFRERESRWGRGAEWRKRRREVRRERVGVEIEVEQPTRAKVLGLRRFYEKLSRGV